MATPDSAPEDGSPEGASSDAVSPPDLTATFAAPQGIDLRLTLAPLRHGGADPTFRARLDGFWVARRTESGPATLRIWAPAGAVPRSPAGAAPLSPAGAAGTVPPYEIRAQAWGPGAADALAAVPGLVGLLDEPGALLVDHPLLRDLQRRLSGLRLPQTGQLLPALIPAVTEQKVTAGEAHAAYSALVRRLGEAAPGPARLLLPPTGSRLAGTAYFEFHPLGLERRRAELLARLGHRAAEIESWIELGPSQAFDRLQRIPGVGPWTAAEAVRMAFGDPDMVSLGDAHLPDLVAWALAREPRADDARMLELLAPYAGQRGRVVRLLEASGIKIPRFGPRFSPRRIADI